MAQRIIGSEWSRQTRNDINDNFTELYNEYVGAGLDAAEAKEKAIQAVADALLAKEIAEATRDELINIIREQTAGGDIVPEVVRARGDEPDLGSRLNSIDQDLAETEQYADYAYSSLSTRQKRRIPLISIVVDDGAVADYISLKPRLDSLGVTAGLGIITSRVGKTFDPGGTYMTWEQIKEMEDAGYEILYHSHTHSNFTTLTEQEMVNEIETGRDILIREGFKPKGFIYPYNAYNNTTNRVVGRYFNYSFAKTEVTNQGRNYINFRNQGIKRIAMGSNFDQANAWEEYPQDTTSLEYYKWRIDEAKENNNWLVFVLHSGATTSEQWDRIVEAIKYAQSQGIPILNPTDAFAIYGNSVELYGDREIIVDSEGKTTGLPYNVLTTPNAFTALSKITEFPRFTVTVNYININGTEGLPVNEPGILITYRLGDQYGYEKQEFRGFSSHSIWVRTVIAYGENAREWSEWRKFRFEVPDKIFTPSIPTTTVNANSTVNVDIPGLDGLRYRDIITVLPASNLPNGIMMMLHRAQNDQITVRFANITSSNITISGLSLAVTVRSRIA